ncbi:hypothetical protein [Xenorhabdus miraniensis]|uniref:Uncharacterized protein n=1 Tax=Xenorhabdus miraniensis TaxID=351674 RepID=A0A2D0JJ62_9GAMM|nr:hypothetical protein [Xenorhabdus miraniensis]PHM45205.1 hypothetical protein Xmir_04353 [Xenorhabdus miraniensis]
MTQNTATSTITVGVKYDTQTLSQLESQLEHIAELMERIQGRHNAGTKEQTRKTYDAGMTLAVERNANTIIENAEEIYRVAAGVHVKEAVIDSISSSKVPSDDHLRQIVREEIDKALRPGGKLYHASLYRGVW